MIEITGKYGKATIYTDNVDTVTYSQVLNMTCQIWSKDSNIKIMPDCHCGKNATVGTTMTIKDKVVPNLVGVDIGCGMLVAKLKVKYMEFGKLDKVIQQKIPSGKNKREHKHRYANNFSLDDLIANVRGEELLAIGSLGGGNHFIEVDKDDEGNYYHFGINKEIMGNKKIRLSADPIKNIILNNGTVLIYTAKTNIYSGEILKKFGKYIELCSEIKDKKALKLIKDLKELIGATQKKKSEKYSEMIELLKHGIITHHGSLPLKQD